MLLAVWDRVLVLRTLVYATLLLKYPYVLTRASQRGARTFWTECAVVHNQYILPNKRINLEKSAALPLIKQPDNRHFLAIICSNKLHVFL